MTAVTNSFLARTSTKHPPNERTNARTRKTYEQPESKYCWIGQGLDTCDDQSIAGIDKGVDPVDNVSFDEVYVVLFPILRKARD